MGIMSYVASPLWLLLLAVTTLEGIKEKVIRHSYFGPGKSLFPVWHISVQEQALILFVVMMVLLLLAKFLSLLIHWRKRERLGLFGGGLKLASSTVCETLVSTLLAPNLAWLQAKFVIGILMGRKIEWTAQDRGEATTTFRDAVRRHWLSTLLGVLWTTALALTVPKLIWWFSPVIVGFILAVPISIVTSMTSSGEWAKRHGLFLTPEELDPPDLLRRFHNELARQQTLPWSTPVNGLLRVLQDPAAWEVHLGLLPATEMELDPLERNQRERLQLKLSRNGPGGLTKKEQRELLLDAAALRSAREVPLEAFRTA